MYYINLICFKKCKTVVFASLTSADSRKIRKSDPTGGNAFAPKRDMKFFAKKGGGKSLDMKKRIYISNLGLKGMSPVNLKKKFKKNVECINGLKMRLKTWQV